MSGHKAEGFRVFAIEDGEHFGILIGKKINLTESPRWAYFYSPGSESLPPNEHILKVCGNCIYPLRSSADEVRVLNLLKGCAEICEKSGPALREIPEDKVCKRDLGYTRIVSRLFEKGRSKNESALGKFIGSSGYFKANILDRDPQKRELLVTASEFGVLQLHEIMPDKELKYLTHIKHTLNIGGSDTPQWFRRTGPVAVDFIQGTVFSRKERLKELKDLVMCNSFSILEGLAATGKTVLVRNLAYNLYNNGELRIYHFKYRDFDVDELAHLINSIRGIIILEDFHLNVLKLQLLYSLLKTNPRRHVLCTLRQGFYKFQRSIEYEDLQKLPTLTLDPFEDVDDIIDSYTSSDGVHVQWTSEAKEKIKEVSQKSFWLLAFALEGYINKEGKGDPKSWLKKGVIRYLDDLECLNRVYPEVLVSLSPLYQNEVMTAESFLIDKNGLGFAPEVLIQLAQRGEMIRDKTEDGFVFYGLPHSALAEAYWEHGGDYRRRKKLKEYEDFIYEYAVSDTPNGLEAVVKTCVCLQQNET